MKLRPELAHPMQAGRSIFQKGEKERSELVASPSMFDGYVSLLPLKRFQLISGAMTHAKVGRRVCR